MPQKLINKSPKRNNALFDPWSIVHLVTGVIFGWLINPYVALILMIVWEPLEVLVLSPILAKYNIVFGHEALVNSLSDIFFDIIGVVLGAWLLTMLIVPPIQLF